jgi:hypothetical protein
MGRHECLERKEKRARDVARSLTVLRGIGGVPWVGAGRLWLLGTPPARPADPEALAGLLLSEAVADRAALSAAAGLSAADEVDAARLTAWARAAAELEAARDIDALVGEGVRPLRRFRGADLRGRIADARQALRRLGMLARALPAARDCDLGRFGYEPGPETCAEALPLRLYALGDWPVDPIGALLSPEVPADGALARLAAVATDSGVATLAALLLSARRHPATGEAPNSNCPSFCLEALAAARGVAPPRIAGLSPEDAATCGRAAERIALLYGIDAARSALDALGQPLEGAGRLYARLRRFEALTASHARGSPGRSRSAAEADVTAGLRRLAAPGVGTARGLAALFLAWAEAPGAPRRLVPRRGLIRLAEDALPRGLAAAARAMSDAWQAAYRAGGEFAETAGTRRERLALALTFPGLDLPLPAAPLQKLSQLRSLVADIPAARLRALWPALVAHDRREYRLHALLRSDIPADLVIRALRHNVVGIAVDFARDPTGLTRYLDCLDRLEGCEVPGLDPKDDWFAQLFRSGRPWAPALALVLVSRAGRGAAPGEPGADLLALARALTGGPLAPAGRALVRALDEWSTPAVHNPPPEFDALAALPGLARVALTEYLHHRRLSGRGETFAEALLAPLHDAEREAQEAVFLRDRLPAAPGLATRLARLDDPALAAERRAGAADRARKRLERSLEVLRRESLDRVLDAACRSYLRDLLGRPVPDGPLPHGLREAFQLLSASSIDHGLLRGFFADVLDGRPLDDRPASRAWLARAAAAGVDTVAWVAGFRAVADIGGRPVIFATEHDPLAVLRMGVYFNTCLSLDGGCNAASTLVNALDVNKHVVYGRRPDGTVVARKLIGATAAGELAGYETYATEHADETRLRLGALLRDFARRCRLRPSDHATPEVLHAGFWYDDGNEPWPAGSAAELSPAPPEVPNDPEALAEWNLRTALAADDEARLQAVAALGQAPWCDVAMCHLLARRPAMGGAFRGRSCDYVCATGADWLSAGGHVAAIRSFSHGRAGMFPVNFACLPADARAVRDALRDLASPRDHNPERDHDLDTLQLPPLLALAPAELLLDAFRTVGELVRKDGNRAAENYWIGQCAELLSLAWLRDGDAAPLARALGGDSPFLTRVVTRLARRAVVPRLAPGLRRLLERGGDDEVGLALGTQGEPQDGPRLLARLRGRPDSLRLAVAVVRSGDAGSAEAARSLWRPPQALVEAGKDAEWLALARELRSPTLAHALSRAARRRALALAGGGGESAAQDLRQLVRHSALLAPAETDGDVPALTRGLFACGGGAAVDALSAVDTECPLLREAGRSGEMAEKLARGPNEAREALAWLRGLCELLPATDRPLLRHEPLEGALRRLAAEQSEDRAAALELLLELTPEGQRPAFAEGCLALVGGDAAALPDGLRARLALACLGAGAGSLCHDHVEAGLAWLAGLPSEVQNEVFRTPGLLGRPADRGDEILVWLLRLADADPRLRDAAAGLLWRWAEWSPDRGLLTALDRALTWLPPEVAEPLATDILDVVSQVCIDEAAAGDLGDWLVAKEPGSYRLGEIIKRKVFPCLPDHQRAALAARIRKEGETPRRLWLAAALDQVTES